MAIPLVDWSIKSIVDYTIRTVQSNPDRYIREIFGDARNEPFAALYGDNFINQISRWISSTKIPVVLGFDLDPAQIPGVSIHLERSAPAQPFLSDTGFVSSESLEPYDREILVPAFSPKKVEFSTDKTYLIVTLPDSMTREYQNLIVPGFIWRDADGNEYGIGEDCGNPTIYPRENSASLEEGNFSRLTVISPIVETSYQDGAMLYDESVLITIHGHSARPEGLWLWAIVQWGLLRFRPLLISTYGLDLGMPSASDFIKDDTFMGENIWRRFISLTTKAVWSWRGPKRQDVAGLILSASFTRAGGGEEVPYLSISSPYAGQGAAPVVVPPSPLSAEYTVEYFTLTLGDELSKTLVLSSNPSAPYTVMIDVFFGGGPMRYVFDFNVSGNVISWAGGRLDGILSASDEIRVVYY